MARTSHAPITERTAGPQAADAQPGADLPGQPQPHPRPRPSELLYTATALGLWAYAHSRFRVAVLGARRLRLRSGLLIVAAHRGSGDVPLLCGSIFFAARLWAQRHPRLHFVTRDEFFARGFAAGYPRRMPLWLRHLLFRVSLAGGLLRVRAEPLRSGKAMKLAQALARLPADARLDELLPAPLLEPIRARARLLGIPEPRTPRALRRGEFADLLWQTVSAADLSAPQLSETWRERRLESQQDMRALVELVRSGKPLLIFPEGRHSPDGRIGPLRRGLEIIVREGEPDTVIYAAVAYDPLSTGRVRACVGFSEPYAPRSQAIANHEAQGALMRTMPLTCGQVLANRLLEAAAAGSTQLRRGAIEGLVAESVSAAAREARHLDPALARPRPRRRRINDCLAAIAVRSEVTIDGDLVSLNPTRILADATLRRLAEEYRSARDLPPLRLPLS